MSDYKDDLNNSENSHEHSEVSRPIVEIYNYLRVQKKWNPSGKVNVTEIYDNVGTSKPTLYSCLEALKEMDLVKFEGFGDRNCKTFVRINSMILENK